MILTGEGKTHADNLPGHIYYQMNERGIRNTLFKETKFGIRFTPVVLETINKTHKTLPYILRNQYTLATEVFNTVVDIPKTFTNVQQSSYCFDIYSRLNKFAGIAEYYIEVYKYLIEPVFRRFGYYSPVMSVVLFIGLICIMGEKYSSQCYSLVWKHFIKNGYPSNVILALAQAIGNDLYMMVHDELDTWSNQK